MSSHLGTQIHTIAAAHRATDNSNALCRLLLVEGPVGYPEAGCCMSAGHASRKLVCARAAAACEGLSPPVTGLTFAAAAAAAAAV